MKRRRGLCPPFIAIGVVVTFMVVTLASALIPEASAASYDGENLPPPGGTWPPTETVSTAQPDATTPDAQPTEPTQSVIWADQQGQGTEDPSSTQQEQVSEQTPTWPEEPTEGDTAEPPEPQLPEVVEDPVGKYPAKPDSTGIKIVSPSLDSLLESGADLEALLYPSGLKLPTKYMDLLMCAPMNSSSTVSGETANFLKTIAPTSTGQYTFAEYSAADVYLAICRGYSQPEGASLTGDALKNLDTNTTVNWMNNITNATISDYSKLVALISNYKSLLESFGSGASINSHKQYKDLIAEHKSVYYSCGDLKAYASLVDGTIPSDKSLSTYTTNLYSTWSYLGVTQNLTSNLLEYSNYFNEFALNGVNYNRGAPQGAIKPANSNEQGTQVTVGDGQGNTTQVTTPDHGGAEDNIVTGSSGQEWTNPSTQGSGDTPVSTVGSSQGVDSSVLPSGRQNIVDIASKVALAFVIIGIIVVWAIHTHRKGF